MSANIYDVAIVGAGVVGAAIARALSAYDLSVVLLEKETDVGFGVSKANSGIVHAAFHHSSSTLKSKLEIQGNLMFERLCHELKFPFARKGIIMAAFSDEEMDVVRSLCRRGEENGSPGIEICDSERLRNLEPKLSREVVGGLFAPAGGVVEPYRFVFALVESALMNGVILKTEFEVMSADWCESFYSISDAFGRHVNAKTVVNAAGLFADTVSKIFNAEEYVIKPRKGEEYLLDRNSSAYPNHVLFPAPSRHSKGILVIPTVEGTTMVGPTAEMTHDKTDYGTSEMNMERIFSHARRMVSAISERDVITAFAGLRPTLDDDDFYIDYSRKAPAFIQVAGIQSPGLTASPAIAEYVKELMKKQGTRLTEKKDYNPTLEKFETFRDKSAEGRDELIKRDPRYANIVCRCEMITEAEVAEAVARGHRTVDGVKFYTRAGMGRCQGGFCSYKIMKLIAENAGISIEDVTKNGEGSRYVAGRLSA